MLDGEIVTGDDDAFKKQTHQTLSVREIESVDSIAERGGESADVVGDTREVGRVHLLCREVFATQTSSVHRRVEAFTSCLELFDTYGTPLVRIQQALNL